MDWLFEPGVRVRRGGHASAYAFRPDLEVFVREVVQNAKDQKRPEATQARVHFGLMILRGESLAAFLKALLWSELQPHLLAAGNQSQHAGFLLRAIDDLKTRRELLLLRVDDSGTGGLVGGDLDRDRPFHSLCIDELFSTKESAGAGGSYGLGKSVLWRFSGLSTVLFSSYLQDSASTPNAKGLRLFGRTQLPWHSIDDEDFDGPCWLGRTDQHDGRPIAWSLWEPASTEPAARLHLNRPTGAGTSILIVGFNPPAEETLHPKELCRRICNLAARHFWPVLSGAEPELRVTSDLLDIESGETLLKAEAEITDEVKPFVSCLDAHRKEEALEAIAGDGDVAAAEISVRIPGTIAGAAPVDAKVTLCVRLAPKLKVLVNHVAYTRGFGMVVKYRNLEGISLSAQPFVAALICGTLRGKTPEDSAVERFLRMAEPPEHDSWSPNQRLQSAYKKGYAVLLDSLDKQVSALIKQLVSQAADEGEKGPELLSKMFPIGTSGADKRKHPFSVVKRTATLTPEGNWLFSGEVRRTAGEGPWRARIALRFSTEDGAEGSVIGAIARLSPAGAICRLLDGVATVDVPEDKVKLEFTGTSDLALHPVSARRAAVRLDISVGLASSERDVVAPRGES